ncbi:MAG TPA: thioredoxin domain-containing protein [Pyrinomonadaceae bacterium]|nr:thioredoxin domain-containing protein [Pyrinomonadaceae bacterium]
MKRLLPFAIIAIVLGAGVVLALYLQKSSAPTPQPTPSPVVGASPTASTPINPGAPGADPPHALGNAEAPATLEEFGDFQCPPCGALHPILKEMAKEYGPTKLRIIFREFPLVPNHVHALAAARASEAAALQGKFWEMHDMIYETQKEWENLFDTRPVFEGYATKIGLNLDKFRADSSSDIVEQRINRDGIRGHSLNVKGTPTVFLNGREVPFESLMVPDKLKAVIDAELKAHQ